MNSTDADYVSCLVLWSHEDDHDSDYSANPLMMISVAAAGYIESYMAESQLTMIITTLRT